MKVIPLLALPLILNSCALIQLPARLINSAISPLTGMNSALPTAPEDSGIALRVSTAEDCPESADH